MQTLAQWQEVIGRVSAVEQVQSEYRIVVDDYTIRVSSDPGLSEGDRVAVLRTETSYFVLDHD